LYMSKYTWTADYQISLKWVIGICIILVVLCAMCIQEKKVQYTGTLVEKQIVYDKYRNENSYVCIIVCNDSIIRAKNDLKIYAKPLNSKVTWTECYYEFRKF
jgi:hypothetical protein